MAKARELAEKMVTKSVLGLRMTKEAINQNIGSASLESALSREQTPGPLPRIPADREPAQEAAQETGEDGIEAIWRIAGTALHGRPAAHISTVTVIVCKISKERTHAQVKGLPALKGMISNVDWVRGAS